MTNNLFVDGGTSIPRKMDGTPHHARSACAPSILSGYTSIHRKIVPVISYHFQNALLMSKSQFDVGVANGVAIDVANDVLPVRWVEGS